MRRPSLLVVVLFRGGRASTPAGVSPGALQERGCSCKVFSQRLSVCEVLISADIGSVSAGLGGTMRTYRHSSAFGAYPGGAAVRRAPEPGPIRGDRGELSDLFVRPFAVLPRDGGATTPIELVTNRGYLVELLTGDSSGRLCPVR
jgi:hypothetical protein